MKITKNTLPDSKIELASQIEWEKVENYKQKALEIFAQVVEVKGFRKGQVPVAIVEKEVSEMALFEKMAELAIEAVYLEMLTAEKVDAIGYPEVIITKIAKGNPLEFKIVTDVIPSFTLPDYKKIAKEAISKKDDAENNDNEQPLDQDVEKTLRQLQEMRAHNKLHEEGGHDHDDHSHGEITDDMLPELNDEFAKSFGFDDVAALRAKVEANITLEKAQREKSRVRTLIMDALIDATEVEIPAVLIQSESDIMLQRMKHDIESMGLSFDDYMTRINKKEADLREEIKGEAKKSVVGKLALEAIAKAENLKPSQEEVEKQVEEILKQYPGADKARAVSYIDETMTNDKALNFLEELK